MARLIARPLPAAVAFMLALLIAGAGSPSPIALAQSVPPATPAPSASSLPSAPPAQSSLADREVFGFLPWWELDSAGTIDMEGLTTLAWFGVEAGRDGQLVRENAAGKQTSGWVGWLSDELTGLMARARQAGVRVVLTVERFSWNKAGRRATKALLRDRAARARLVEDIVSTVVTRGAGGVNLDFEPLPKVARGNFVRLVRALRAAFDAVDPSLQLTFDMTPDVTTFPLGRLVKAGAADAAILMGYEYRTNSSRVTGSIAPLRNPNGPDLRTSVKRALKHAPADRLILALPWYGRAWSTKNAAPGSRTRSGARFIRPATAWYEAAVARAAVAGVLYESKQASAWSRYRSRACETCPLSWRQLWFDDADSVIAKVGFANRQRLRGVGIWALGYQGTREELWSALRFALDRAADHQPPSGTASIAAESILGELDGVPIVDDVVSLDLSATDGAEGSGIALVRVSTRRRVLESGSLKFGTTFPAVDRLSISLPGAKPVDEVFVPGSASSSTPATPAPSPVADPSGVLTPGSTSVADATTSTIRVQWRDIAGNWSEPLRLRVIVGPVVAPPEQTAAS